MLYFNFSGYDGFKYRFGMLEHGNGKKSRKNAILLAYVKNRELLRECIKKDDFTLLNITNMADLKKKMFNAIQASGEECMELNHRVELINNVFYSSIYQTDSSKGLCADGDFKAIRYMNMKSGGKVYKKKAGAFIRALITETPFGKTLPEQILIYLQECFVQDWQSFSMATLPENNLFVNKEFNVIYSRSECEGDFNSCMTGKGLHSFYEDAVDASAAYLRNKEGKIIARCVIYNHVHEEGSNRIWRLAERQYSTDQNDVLKRALVDALIRGGYIDGYKQVGFSCHDSRGFVDTEGNSLSDREFWIECSLSVEDTVSYQDSFKWYDIGDDRAYNYEPNDYDYNLDITEGSIERNLNGDDDDLNWDEWHNCETESALETVHYNGSTYDCADDDLDDFRYTPQGWYHIDEVERCPTCNNWFVKENGVTSEITGETYCDRACMSKAEEDFKEANWYYSDYDGEYYENEEDLVEFQCWSEANGYYEKMTISKETLADAGFTFYGGKWYDKIDESTGEPKLLEILEAA